MAVKKTPPTPLEMLRGKVKYVCHHSGFGDDTVCLFYGADNSPVFLFDGQRCKMMSSYTRYQCEALVRMRTWKIIPRPKSLKGKKLCLANL